MPPEDLYTGTPEDWLRHARSDLALAKVPLTHSIRALLDLLPAGTDLPVAVSESAELTGYAVQSRYPGAIEAVTDEEYARAVSLAGAVIRWAEDQVSSTDV